MGRGQECRSSLGWWGQRWLRYIRGLGIGPRTPSQLASAVRAVASLSTGRGWIGAQVEVGRYGAIARVQFRVRPLSERSWRRAMDEIAADSEASLRLLRGTPGEELETAFERAGLTLFPEPTAMNPVRCSCREKRDCRHANALLIRTAELFDANPFIWLEILGMPRDPLFAGVRARLSDIQASEGKATGSPDNPGDEFASSGRFWSGEIDPDTIPVQPGTAVAPDSLLRILGPIPDIGEDPVVLYTGDDYTTSTVDQALKTIVTAIAETASGLARSEREPMYRSAPIDGKSVPVHTRLAYEVADAVRAAEHPLSLAQLRDLCPTAAALRWEWEKPLRSSLEVLPHDVIELGNRVAVRDRALLRASFIHIVSFDEWWSRRLPPSTDWLTAMSLCGHAGPIRFSVGPRLVEFNSLLDEVNAEIGDELRLSILDPAEPVLKVEIVKTESRDVHALNFSSAEAAKTLTDFMVEAKRESLTREEAVRVLLGARHYRRGIAPDAIWMLPQVGQGLFHGTSEDVVSMVSHFWTRRFGEPRYGHWDETALLKQFQKQLAARGCTAKQLDAATSCIKWWCSHYGGEQGGKHDVVEIGSLLEFLWVAAPEGANRRGLTLEAVANTLAYWFEFLAGLTPERAQDYSPHIAACSLKEAYALRAQTLKDWRSRGISHWRTEAIRWIGRLLFFEGYHPACYRRRYLR